LGYNKPTASRWQNRHVIAADGLGCEHVLWLSEVIAFSPLIRSNGWNRNEDCALAAYLRKHPRLQLVDGFGLPVSLPDEIEVRPRQDMTTEDLS